MTIVPSYRLRLKVARRMGAAAEDYRKGKNVSTAFTNAKDARRWLEQK